MISWIVGNMHVGTSNTGVVREFYRRFKYAAQRGFPDTKEVRKRVYRQALKAHHANQQLCRDFRL